MRFVLVVVSMVLISCVLPEVCQVRGQGPEKAPKVSTPEIVEHGNRNHAPPVVEGWEPKTGSIGSIIYLTGYRLGEGTKGFFIQNGVEFPAGTAGRWIVTNNEHNKPQTLGLIVPERVVPGHAQIVVELDGRRSLQ